MKVKHLLNGIQEVLKNHPEIAEWEVYNTEEHSRSVDFGFIPENYHTSSGPGKIPDFARVDLWYYQKWYYDVNKLEPEDYIKEKWRIEEAHERVLKWLKGIYQFHEYSVDDVVPGSHLLYCDEVFCGANLPNVALNITYMTEEAVKHKEFFAEGCGLNWVYGDAAKNVMGCQQTGSIKSILEAGIIERLSTIESAKYAESILHKPLQECFHGCSFENVPFDLGGGTIIVCSFEF